MAASATMGSTAGLTTRLTASRIHLSAPIFLLPSRRPLRVRCQAEDPQQSPIPKPIQKKVSFNDLLAFRGPAPERINGRLAMVGFVSALAVEAALGDDLFAQLAHGGVPLFLGTAALLSAASLVPLFKGVSPQSRSDGLMTADAEMWNGRFAMLGLVALAFTEYLKGGPLV